jgi:PKD repeat protein
LLSSTPLNDLGTGSYNGQEGGLYPNGTDQRPAAVETLAEKLAAQVAPLDANGNVNTASGKVALLSIGMSNTALEWNGGAGAFEPVANADPSKNGDVVVVNGAQFGADANAWADPNSYVWNAAQQSLQQASVTVKQVEVVWLKEALAVPAQYGGFLPAAQKLQSDLEAIARNLKTHYPNIKIAYLSSRTHAFTSDLYGLNPEPYAYESGFAVKWAIQDQIDGKGNLNDDPAKGPVTAPLLSWGPYLWANGVAPRSDGFTWTLNDVGADLTHPSPSGVAKVGQELLAFFKTDPTATPWFLHATPASAAPVVTVSADHTSGASGLVVHFTASATGTNGHAITQYAWTYDDGDFAYGAAPTKTFYAPGTYHVHLAVMDSAGDVTLRTITITIAGSGGGTPIPPPLPPPPPPSPLLQPTFSGTNSVRTTQSAFVEGSTAGSSGSLAAADGGGGVASPSNESLSPGVWQDASTLGF